MPWVYALDSVGAVGFQYCPLENIDSSFLSKDDESVLYGAVI